PAGPERQPTRTRGTVAAAGRRRPERPEGSSYSTPQEQGARAKAGWPQRCPPDQAPPKGGPSRRSPSRLLLRANGTVFHPPLPPNFHIRQRASQSQNARFGNVRVAHGDPAEVRQLRQIFQSRVGDPAAIQVQDFHAGQAGELGQTSVGDLGVAATHGTI